MTLKGVMAITLPYFAEFGSFRGELRKSGRLAINRFSPEKCHKVHQARQTRCAVRGSGASCIICPMLYAICYSYGAHKNVRKEILDSYNAQ